MASGIISWGWMLGSHSLICVAGASKSASSHTVRGHSRSVLATAPAL